MFRWPIEWLQGFLIIFEFGFVYSWQINCWYKNITRMVAAIHAWIYGFQIWLWQIETYLDRSPNDFTHNLSRYYQRHLPRLALLLYLVEAMSGCWVVEQPHLSLLRYHPRVMEAFSHFKETCLNWMRLVINHILDWIQYMQLCIDCSIPHGCWRRYIDQHTCKDTMWTGKS